MQDHQEQLDEALAILRAYSLLQRESEQQTLRVHRLVQANIPVQRATEWKQRVILAVNAASPDPADITQWNRCEQWLPHALVCAEWIEQEQIGSLDAARLLNQAGYYLQEPARSPEAEPLFQRALAIREQQLGEMHPNTATSLNNLALLYYQQGRYQEAEPLYQRALTIREQQLGPLHPDTAQSLTIWRGFINSKEGTQKLNPIHIKLRVIRAASPSHPVKVEQY
jgi:tetratricopeptide (TPR) repeat protein